MVKLAFENDKQELDFLRVQNDLLHELIRAIKEALDSFAEDEFDALMVGGETTLDAVLNALALIDEYEGNV